MARRIPSATMRPRLDESRVVRFSWYANALDRREGALAALSTAAWPLQALVDHRCFRWRPQGQPRHPHRRRLPDPPRHPRPGPLPAQARRGQDPHGGDALPEAAPPTRSIDSSAPTPRPGHQRAWTRVREGTAGRHIDPALPASSRTPTLRISHLPGPHQRRYPRPRRHGRPRLPNPRTRLLTTEGSHSDAYASLVRTRGTSIKAQPTVLPVDGSAGCPPISASRRRWRGAAGRAAWLRRRGRGGRPHDRIPFPGPGRRTRRRALTTRPLSRRGRHT